MGRVAVTVKIMPKDPDVDLDKLKGDIKKVVPKDVDLKKFDVKPVAFGLMALYALFIMEDKEGGTEEVERAISKLDDVESVQVENVGLI